MNLPVHTPFHPRFGSCILFAFVLIVLMFETSLAQQNRSDSLSSPLMVEIAGTESLHFTSSIVGQEFNLYVNLPRDYGDTSKSFPVIYLLDGQWDFTLLNALFGQQYYDGFIPSVIVVGIAWGGNNPDYDFLRARDLTPSMTKQAPQGGNAPKFLGFIKKELIPFIDSRYRTKKDDRTLMGSSLGGLFTLYTLFQGTTSFNRYVLTSPAIGWDNEVIDSFEKNYSPAKSQLPIRLFMAVGGLEGNASLFEKFAGDLKAKKLDGLEIETKVLEGTGHSGGKAEGYTRGLQFVFARHSVGIDPMILDRYVGTYQVKAGMKLTIAREEVQLVILTPDGEKLTLCAENQNDFYRNGQYLFIHFKNDNNGKVVGFQSEQYGGQQFFEKNN